MDGAIATSQCAIAPDSKFTYNFTVDQPGTYWYHSHQRGQYPDGLRGALLVNDPDSPHKNKYDEEIVLTLSDWYHDLMPGLIQSFMSRTNPTGAEPVPDTALMNDGQNKTFPVVPGKTYFFRIVNIGAFAAQYLWFEGHDMQIVEVDGVYTKPSKAERIYVTAAQRYGVLVTARSNTNANFPIVGSMDQDLFDAVPPTLNPNVTGWLVYDDKKSLPDAKFIDEFDEFDDFDLVPYDEEPLLENVDKTVELTVAMNNLGDGANYAFFNDITYTAPRVPSLYTALSTGEMASNPEIYGVNTNSFVLAHKQVVEIILNNDDPGKHPFHLHGHAFQVIARSAEEAGPYVHNETFPQKPMRRDTVLVRPNGNFVIRFRSDNPGVWLFHCHIEWHVVSGLTVNFVEAPLELQKQLTVPDNHYQACREAETAYKGNAAGNTENLLDLNGNNLPPDPLPEGFTARGIVALVFSVISAFLGVAVIAWYGTAPLGKSGVAAAEKRIREAGVN
ncbi:MAG: hypothetical protein M1831_001885 [Alyxoria varia]|nr:MAG: hypothetical protein M1831_001885 [Alyxoria varia]